MFSGWCTGRSSVSTHSLPLQKGEGEPPDYDVYANLRTALGGDKEAPLLEKSGASLLRRLPTQLAEPRVCKVAFVSFLYLVSLFKTIQINETTT